MELGAVAGGGGARAFFFGGSGVGGRFPPAFLPRSGWLAFIASSELTIENCCERNRSGNSLVMILASLPKSKNSVSPILVALAIEPVPEIEQPQSAVYRGYGR